MTKKNIIIASVVLVIILLIFLLPVSIPMTIDAPCKIKPTLTWVVRFGNDGNVITSLHNSQSGTIENFFSAVPERGDSYRFQLVKNPPKHWVEKGDTIGIIHSNLLSQDYAELTGKLKTNQATLHVLLTGEKESLVKYARQQLNAAIEHAQYEKEIYDRKKQLFEKNLISSEENEQYRSQAKQAEIDVAAKRAYLESVQTGGKQEQINLVKNEINAVEQQIKVLNEKYESYVITSPISGNLNSYNSKDTILTVNSPQSVLFIPVDWKYRSLLHEGLPVDLKISDFAPVKYKVKQVIHEIKQFNNIQVFTLVAITNDENPSLPANLWTTCSLNFGEVSLFEFLKWKLMETYEV